MVRNVAQTAAGSGLAPRDRQLQTETLPAHGLKKKASRPVQGGTFVLVVDDNEDDLFLESRTLGRAGVSQAIITAQDGLEALDLIHASRQLGRGLPSLVMVDLRLPRQSGIEVLQMLRTAPSTARVPVIVLTGCPCGAAAFPIGDFQHAAFLGKPVTVESFQRVARELSLDHLFEGARDERRLA